MTHATFNDIRRGYRGNILNIRDNLSAIADGLKEQYRFACENYGNASVQAGDFDRMLCAVQAAVEVMKTVDTIETGFLIIDVDRHDMELISKVESMGTWEYASYASTREEKYDVWSFNDEMYRIYEGSDKI